MIQQLLIKYLLQNGRLGIPDIGIFQVKRIPAQVMANGTEIKGPESVITYHAEPVPADKHLFEFLSSETETDEVTVIGQFNAWVQELKQKIFDHQTIEIPFIGTLLLDEDGKIIHSAPVSEMGYKTVPLPNGVVLENTTVTELEEMSTSDTSWWIYGIILLLLGVAAIAYYYL
ncbi:MAG: hypothetical protein IBJ16_10305 [Chitinophagaceae bacterium]|nr:hypothetical protein [Chitinophagaceae bacterium]